MIIEVGGYFEERVQPEARKLRDLCKLQVERTGQEHEYLLPWSELVGPVGCVGKTAVVGLRLGGIVVVKVGERF